MCGKKWASLLLLSLLALPLSGQSFDPSAVYEVTGAWLIERQAESKTANEALTNSKTENEQLRKKIAELSRKLETDSTDRQAKLTEVSRQLNEASTLLKKSQSEALSRDIVVGLVALSAGALAGMFSH